MSFCFLVDRKDRIFEIEMEETWLNNRINKLVKDYTKVLQEWGILTNGGLSLVEWCWRKHSCVSLT